MKQITITLTEKQMQNLAKIKKASDEWAKKRNYEPLELTLEEMAESALRRGITELSDTWLGDDN